MCPPLSLSCGPPPKFPVPCLLPGAECEYPLLQCPGFWHPSLHVVTWWSLFLNHFNFTLAFLPGSKNAKPDALLRLHSSVQSIDEPATILPPKTLVATACLKVKVEEALAGTTQSVNMPLGLLHVPSSLRSKDLQWAHSTQPSCHPGLYVQPLSIAHLPWSHISLDFVTGLPESRGPHRHPVHHRPVFRVC